MRLECLVKKLSVCQHHWCGDFWEMQKIIIINCTEIYKISDYGTFLRKMYHYETPLDKYQFERK